ncbi:MAG: ATP-binding cassette domain-containing protein, partial [Thermoproteota archaeon]
MFADYDINAPPVFVEGLVVKYGSFIAVDGVSFTVKPGEIYGLLGPNGAGKTSTLKVLTGLLKPASGRVEIFGRPLSDEVAVKSM